MGGGQEELKREGERFATQDYKVAKPVANKRLKELRGLREAGQAASTSRFLIADMGALWQTKSQNNAREGQPFGAVTSFALGH